MRCLDTKLFVDTAGADLVEFGCSFECICIISTRRAFGQFIERTSASSLVLLLSSSSSRGSSFFARWAWPTIFVPFFLRRCLGLRQYGTQYLLRPSARYIFP